MIDKAFIDSAMLLFVLLNPFLMSIYLMDLIDSLDARTFGRVLLRGAGISCVAFVVFAWAGDTIFSRVLQVRFSAFLIFGGIVFLVVAIQYVLIGSRAISSLRGEAEHVSGSIAMPFMIGPGTVSASILAGSRLPLASAALSIFAALGVTVLSVIGLKCLYDIVKKQNEPLVRRYTDVVGRISALIIGTFAIEMIMKGFDMWLD